MHRITCGTLTQTQHGCGKLMLSATFVYKFGVRDISPVPHYSIAENVHHIYTANIQIATQGPTHGNMQMGNQEQF